MFAAGPARAQDASAAQLAFERGVRFYAERKLEEAIEALLASYRLVPNANVAFNIAQASALAGRHDEAFNWYQTHLGFPLDAAARERAQSRLDALASQVAVLDIRTEPAGAELYIDRVELGSLGASPRKLAVPAGEHSVIARFLGHEQASATVFAKTGTVVTVELALEPWMGSVEVTSEPAGARVVNASDGRVLSATPARFPATAGEHALVLKLERHLDEQVRVLVRRGETTAVALTLERDPSSFARLSVRGKPGGDVFVDGQRVGAVPALELAVEPGLRALMVRHGAAVPWQSTVDLRGGSAMMFETRTEDKESGGIGVWRWVGYGAAAALLVTAGIVGLMALDENRHVEGTPGASVERRDRLNLMADLSLGAGVLVAGATLVADLSLGTGPARPRVVVRAAGTAP